MKKSLIFLFLIYFAKVLFGAEVSTEVKPIPQLAQAVVDGDIEKIRALLKSGAKHYEAVMIFDFSSQLKFLYSPKEEFRDKLVDEFMAWEKRTNKFFDEIDEFYKLGLSGELPKSIYNLINEGIFVHSIRGADHNTPLMAVLDNKHYAIFNLAINLVKQLISMKSDVNKSNRWDKTLLQTAVESNNLECTKLLLDSGANINIAGDVGYTPINSAVRHMEKISMELINFLIKQKPDLHIANEYEETPLHWAINWYVSNASLEYVNKTKEERLQIINDLLEAGANPYYSGPKHKDTPFDWAKNDSNVIKLIQEKTVNKIFDLGYLPAPLTRLIAQYALGSVETNKI